MEKEKKKATVPVEIVLIIAFLAVWFLLQLVVLPRLGIPT